MDEKEPPMKKHQILQGVVTTLLVALIFVLESKSALGAYHAQTDHISGLQFGALSLVSAAIAFIGFGLAGRMKDDYRGHVRGRALFARLVSLAFLVVPIAMLATSIKAENSAREWAAYTASPAFAADTALSQDMMSDRIDRQQASERLVEPVVTGVDILDPALWIAAMLQGLLIFASDALRVPAPMSAAEFEHLKRSNAAKKAAATRKQRKAKKPVLKVVKA
tara:strand:+ start:296 stop:961 length:666 start_codon:yes stop_codon:yes gene_type:complete